MIIEILYPELCSLYGDSGNIRYLHACMPEAEIKAVRLGSDEVPFTGDLICMGPTTEKNQELIAGMLLKHRSRFTDAVEEGKHFLFTGNAFEICGQYIQDGSRQIECLGAFPFFAVRDMEHRHNSLYIGRFEPGDGVRMDVVGFRSQFSFSYGDLNPVWLDTRRGVGSAGDIKSGEGIRYKNFTGTYLLGPILPLNPDLTQYLMRSLGSEAPIAFEETARAAYSRRIEEFWACDAAQGH